MEKKAVPLNPEMLALHTASTSNKSSPKHHTSPSEHSVSSRHSSHVSLVSSFKKSPLSRKRVSEESLSKSLRAFNEEPSESYATPWRRQEAMKQLEAKRVKEKKWWDEWMRFQESKQLEELEQLQKSEQLEKSEQLQELEPVQDVDSVSGLSAAKPRSVDRPETRETTEVLNQFTERTTEILTDLQTATTAQAEALINYIKSQSERQIELHNALVGRLQADEARDAAPRTTATPPIEFEEGASQPPGVPPGIQGSASELPNPASSDPVGRVRRTSEMESQSEGSSNGGNVAPQEVRSLENVLTPTPHTFVKKINESKIQGSLSGTHNFFLRTYSGNTVSLGVQVRFPFDEAGFKKGGIFFVLDTRGAVQNCSPVVADGKGSSQKLELQCCDFGLQLERGTIFPIEGEGFHFHRGALSVPKFTEGLSIQPYAFHVEGEKVSIGVGLEPVRGSFQLCDAWYIPDVKFLGNFIFGQEVVGSPVFMF